jgi:hypothetical protein
MTTSLSSLKMKEKYSWETCTNNMSSRCFSNMNYIWLIIRLRISSSTQRNLVGLKMTTWQITKFPKNLNAKWMKIYTMRKTIVFRWFFVDRVFIYSIDRYFLSLDLMSANYNALRYYDPDLVCGTTSWIQFLSLVTKEKYFLESKSFRSKVCSLCFVNNYLTRRFFG